MLPYRVLISVDFLHLPKPSPKERKAILAFLKSLENEPETQGDFEEADETGRAGQIKIIGKFALTFWTDHAVREIKVTRFELADRG